MADMVFTGPRLKIVYSGCHWNTVVFCMDDSQAEFTNWLNECWEWFKDTVSADPVRFKVNGRHGPQFSTFIVTPTRDPELYPDELRCRLATGRRANDDMDAPVTAVIECKGEKVDPTQVWSGGFMTPIFKMGYYKDGDEFGLTLTVLKAEYEPSMYAQVSNDTWMIDANV